MQIAAARHHAAASLSDRALARHLVAVAELTALERDHHLSLHLLNIAYDLFGEIDAAPADER